jgi:hypothetical protein
VKEENGFILKIERMGLALIGYQFSNSLRIRNWRMYPNGSSRVEKEKLKKPMVQKPGKFSKPDVDLAGD